MVTETVDIPSSPLTLSIAYDLLGAPLWRLLGWLLARPYSRWCLRQMVGDTKRALEMRVKLTA